MENLQIQTSQNVEIEHNIASVGERMVAHILDYCFIFVYLFIVSLIEVLTKFNSIAFLLLLILPILFYDLFFEIVYNGQNPGKMIMKLKVVKLDGTSAGIGSYFLRWIFRIIDNILISGAIATITIIINGRGQRLGDIAAGTIVIRLTKKFNLSDTIHISLPLDYKPVFEEAKLLNENDIRIIKETIEFLKENPGSASFISVGDKAKQALEKKLNIRSQLAPVVFLQTLLKDYNCMYV